MKATAAPEEVDALVSGLGPTKSAFERLQSIRRGATTEWRRYTKAGPWTLKVSDGKRTLCYLTPGDGGFHVTLILGERATATALADAEVPEAQKQALRDARPYAEGRGLRVAVSDEADIAIVERLLAIKLGERPAS